MKTLLPLLKICSCEDLLRFKAPLNRLKAPLRNAVRCANIALAPRLRITGLNIPLPP